MSGVAAPENIPKVKTEGVIHPVTSTPPSSPPLALKMERDKKMPPPSVPASASRKRSNDEMHGVSQSAGGSRTADADFAPLASQGEDDTSVDSSDIKTSDSQQSQARQAAAKSSIKTPDSQTEQLPPSTKTSDSQPEQLPRSGQGSQKPRSKSAKDPKSSRPDAASLTTTDDEDEESDPSASIDESEPQDRIQDFDWDDLQQRYHQRMDEFAHKEQAISDEFMRLVDVSTA